MSFKQVRSGKHKGKYLSADNGKHYSAAQLRRLAALKKIKWADVPASAQIKKK